MTRERLLNRLMRISTLCGGPIKEVMIGLNKLSDDELAVKHDRLMANLRPEYTRYL